MAFSDASTTFAAATAIKSLSSHTYEAYFPDDWCIGSVPHGGFVTACFLQVASTHFSGTLATQNQPHTFALHLDFLRRTEVGPATFTVKDVKLGRQASVVQVTLSQNGREEVVGTLTQGNIPAESGVNFSTEWKLNPEPLPTDLALLPEGKDKHWVREKEMRFANFRKATKKTEFYFPRGGQRSKSSADEWVRLSTGEKWTNASIGFISDMWPMPVESFLQAERVSENSERSKRTFWYPTVLLNLDIKKTLPESGVEWLFARTNTKQIKEGRLDIEVTILDAEGELVALSNHVAFAVSSERNLAARSTIASKI